MIEGLRDLVIELKEKFVTILNQKHGVSILIINREEELKKDENKVFNLFKNSIDLILINQNRST